MYISKFQINNYKSYREPVELIFKPGFNIITGKNSAGKTALLESLALQFIASPHRSTRTVPLRGVEPPASSIVRMTITLSREEFVGFLAGNERYLPWSVGANPSAAQAFDASPKAMQRLADWLLEQPTFHISLYVQKSTDNRQIWRIEGPAFGLYEMQPHVSDNKQPMIGVRFHNGQISSVVQSSSTYNENVCMLIARTFSSRVYRFSAERFTVGQCAFGNNPILEANARNLPEVLNGLQHNTQLLIRFNTILRDILPQVKQVTIRPLPNRELEATVWPHDIEREDLAIPLNQCGSGVGQVLAVLYVVMTSHHPQTIIIDEPQSFLHPGAIRKLIEVLKMYGQHQYIMATHSPTVISSADPTTLTMAQFSDGETNFQIMNPAEAKDLQFHLAEIGARLADVFGADNILWVEGQTEEACFPTILRSIVKRPLMGTAILAVRNTGDFEKGDAKRIIEIYQRLSTASALLPPAIAFIFDRECRAQIELDDLQRRGYLVKFIPRRMYENYLLHPLAITAILNSLDELRTQPLTETDVAVLIEQKRQQLSYYCKSTKQIPENWKDDVDGAQILNEVFNELSETRVPFDKVKHSTLLTEWLVSNTSGELSEIADILRRIMDTVVQH